MSIAGGAGLLAFILMRSIVSGPSAPTQVVQTVGATEVLVARKDIPLGSLTKESDFRWQTWPADAVTPAFISKKQGAAGMRMATGAIVRSPILEGEPVTRQKLIKAGDGGVLAAILPKGMRAISTRIKEETAAGRLILPNDHVDVILTRRLRGNDGQDAYVSDTLFHNVRVLAVGQQIDTGKDNKSSQAGNTATLELTPEQAEMLARANSMGEISLSLRSIADADPNGPGPSSDPFDSRRSTAVRVLKYGVPTRAYSVN
jgi:pilus assembly protein CpaB